MLRLSGSLNGELSIPQQKRETMNLSPNFTLEELIFSQTALRNGISNQPDDGQVANLTRLCQDLLEPARAMLGVPFRIDSGFRCRFLNQSVGGATTSAHLDGRAADLIPINTELRHAFDILRNTSLPYDQIILECNAWIHLAIARDGATPRRMALTASGGPGEWHYIQI